MLTTKFIEQTIISKYDVINKIFLELAKLTSELFPQYLPESFYTASSTTSSSSSTKNAVKCARGTFQVYYGKVREKEIAIGRLKIQQKKRKLDEEGIIFLYKYDNDFINLTILFILLNFCIEKKNIF